MNDLVSQSSIYQTPSAKWQSRHRCVRVTQTYSKQNFINDVPTPQPGQTCASRECTLMNPRQREGRESWRDDVKNVSLTAEHQGKTQRASIDARRRKYWHEVFVRYDSARQEKTDYKRALPYVII